MKQKNFSTANKFYDKNVVYSKLSFEKDNMLPHRYVFILTNKCNLACTFCFQERKTNPNRMNTENWLDLIKQVPENSRITLTGGEPLVYKDFNLIFKTANIKNETNIVTNGVLLSDKVNETLLSEKNFKVLGISIDTLGNINRDFKKGMWENLVKNIKNFRKKRDEINHECAIDIKTVVLDENVKDLFEINKFLFEELNIDTHSIQLLKGAEIQHSDLMFDYEQIHKRYKAYQYPEFKKLVEQLEKIREHNYSTNNKIYLHPNIIPMNSKEKITEEKFGFLNDEDHDPNNYDTCYSPWTSVHINVDGHLFPCMAVSMGNVKNDKLNNIIFSEKFRNFKNEIRLNKTINGCNRCGWLKCKKF